LRGWAGRMRSALKLTWLPAAVDHAYSD